MATDWKERELGAFWTKNDFFTGKLKIGGEMVSVIMFPNKKATDDNKQPKFHVYKSEEMNQGGSPAPAPAKSVSQGSAEEPPEFM